MARPLPVSPATFGVELSIEPRRPILDPTFGIEVPRSSDAKTYSRRLVVLGDSLSQGFHHAAVHDTEISFPAMIAAQLDARDFAFPSFPGLGGYPWNLEDLLRLDDGGLLPSIEHVLEYLVTVKRAYAPTGAAVLPTPAAAPNDNLAVWGWDLRDLLERTVETELMEMHPQRAFDRFLPIVDHPSNRTAITTLGEWRVPPQGGHAGLVTNATALQLAAERGATADGIETLLIWIGSNNALGVFEKLRIIPSGPDYASLQGKKQYNVWTPAHFAAELAVLEDQVRDIRAEHVIWGTVPHITIPPISRGLGSRLEANPRYFEYYARPWQTDESFDPTLDEHLTGDDAWLIDTVIDEYNSSIATMVATQRKDGRDWRVVDFCGMLDRLAVRRNSAATGGTRPDYLPEYPLPPELAGMTVSFFDTDKTGRLNAGGIIGLDGIHPTTVGYGLVAHEAMKVMEQAGVVFPNGSTPDWAAIKAADTLLSDPPTHVDDVLRMIRMLNEELDVLHRPFWRKR